MFLDDVPSGFLYLHFGKLKSVKTYMFEVRSKQRSVRLKKICEGGSKKILFNKEIFLQST